MSFILNIIVLYYFWDKCIVYLSMIENIISNRPSLQKGCQNFLISSKKAEFTDVLQGASVSETLRFFEHLTSHLVKLSFLIYFYFSFSMYCLCLVLKSKIQ